MTRLRGRAPRGERLVAKVPHGHWKTTSLIGALGIGGVRCATVVDGAINRDVFDAFVEQVLAPELKPGDVVILDNLSSHKSEKARKLIESRGARLEFLPPYSPDLNPIEMVFAKIKQLLRSLGCRTKEALWQPCSRCWIRSRRPTPPTASATAVTRYAMTETALAEHGITRTFFDLVVKQAIDAGLTSDEHFTVDGSLIQSHASLKSLKKIERAAWDKDDRGPSGRNPSVDFKGERRTNATHASTTDPEAKLYKKGDGVGAFLCHSGHALTENRHELVMSVRMDEACGTAERTNALAMLDHAERQPGADEKPAGRVIGPRNPIAPTTLPQTRSGYEKPAFVQRPAKGRRSYP